MTWMTLDSQIAPIIAIAALLCAICVETRRQIGRSQRRALELKMTADLLDQHRAALEEFLAAAEAPNKLKFALLEFSRVASDRDAAHRVVSAACSGEQKTQGEADAAKAFAKSLEALRATHPDLAHTFETAVGSITVSMFFRWSANADMFREYLAKAMVDARKGADLVARASRYASEHDHPSSLIMGPRQAYPA